jgi:hypothetical protein
MDGEVEIKWWDSILQLAPLRNEVAYIIAWMRDKMKHWRNGLGQLGHSAQIHPIVIPCE